MSAAEPTFPASAAHGAEYADACPLCGAQLAADQDWCLRCGAAARTRLAATPGWRAPLALLLVLAAICIAVLAASLVKLARGPGPAPPPITHTITLPSVSTGAGAGTTGTP